MRSRLPSPALCLALLALLLSLGGAALAAKTAKKNTVTSKSVKNNSLTGADLKADTVTGADIDESSLAGVPGAAVAYARVGPDASVDSGLSSGVAGVVKPSNGGADAGNYCIALADGIQPRGLQATIDFAQADARNDVGGSLAPSAIAAFPGCPATTDAVVVTRKWTDGSSEGSAFYVVFY